VFTFQHWAGVRPYATSCEFAGSCVFSKQSPLALCLAVRHPFYRRYGANLPSSFGGTLSSPKYSLRTHTRQARYSAAAGAPPHGGALTLLFLGGEHGRPPRTKSGLL